MVRSSFSAILVLFCTLLFAPAAFGQTISFASVAQKALEKSYDLKLSTVETALAKNKIREAKEPFYPTLNGSVNTEYVAGIGNQNTLQSQQAIVVGNTILPGNTRFQNAISLNGNYTIADFGSRINQLRAAKQHHLSTQLQQLAQRRDLELEVLDAYTQALLTYKQCKAKEHQIALQKQRYEFSYRLSVAGKISRIELGEQAIALKNAETELQEATEMLGEHLNKLSSYTQEPYYVPSVVLEDFDPEHPIGLAQFVPAAMPDFKAFDLLIREKVSEMKSLNAQRYPQLVAFSNFVLYGSNKEDWMGSMGGIRARAGYFGIGLQLPVFDAFKTRIAVDQKKLEIAQLAIQRDKKLWELRSDYHKSATSAGLYKVELETKAELVSSSKEQLGMVIRLTESQVAEKTKALDEQIELNKRQLAEDTTKIKAASAAKRLRIYAEAASK